MSVYPRGPKPPFFPSMSNVKMAFDSSGPAGKKKVKIGGVSHTLKWFMDFTSIGGLAQLHGTDLSVSKVIWLFLLVLGSIMTVVGIYQVIDEFMMFQVSTKVTLEDKPLLTFPAVTICNQNKVHCGQLASIIENCDSSCDAQMETYCDLYVYGQCEPSVNVSEKFSLGKIVSKPQCQDFKIKIPDYAKNDPIAKRSYFQAKFLRYYSRLNSSEAFAMSHQPDKMFKKCVYEANIEDEDCSELLSGSAKFFNPNYGFCYSFNYRGIFQNNTSDKKPRDTPFIGPYYGLTIEIDIEGTYYLRNGLTEHEGVKVILHEPTDHPIISSNSLDILPNVATSLSLMQTEVSRSGPPYITNCTTTWADSNIKLSDKDYRYESKLCQSKCIHDLIQSKCNCSIAQLADLHTGKAGVTYCNTNEEPHKTCVPTTIKTFTLEELSSSCQCPPQCFETRYVPSVTSSLWPSKHYWAELASTHGIIYNGSAISTADLISIETNTEANETMQEYLEAVGDYVQNNYLQVKVYFGSKTVETILELPQFNVFSFLASLGGATSLYLGVSFVVLFEAFEIVLRLALYACGYRTM